MSNTIVLAAMFFMIAVYAEWIACTCTCEEP
jgi:hypothetical protein